VARFLWLTVYTYAPVLRPCCFWPNKL